MHSRNKMSEPLNQTQEYLSFRGNVPLRKIFVESGSLKDWKIYDCGPKSIKTPLVCLPPASGTADVFYKQAISLSAKGIRVISVEAPVYWNVEDWCEGFKKLMDQLGLLKVHLFGASLGGYLAQKFAENTILSKRVASLILCNTFIDTTIFKQQTYAHLFWLMPASALKRMILGSFYNDDSDEIIIRTAEFMSDKLESLTQQELASRLAMNCAKGYVEVHKLAEMPVTIIDVFDKSALCNNAREEVHKSYPHAKLAHLKSGGNFPYLSRSVEVNLHIQIHLSAFDNTDISASETPLLSTQESL